MENKSVSALALVVSNLVPLFGVWFFAWDLSLIMVLYWLENVVIGILNVFKIINARGPQVPAQAKPDNVAINNSGRWSLAGFFLLHYGIFTFVHGIFVFTLFGLPKMPFASLLIPFTSLLLSHIFLLYQLSGRGRIPEKFAGCIFYAAIFEGYYFTPYNNFQRFLYKRGCRIKDNSYSFAGCF